MPKLPDTVSRAPLAELPPQTLFTESTPHAQGLQNQPPVVRLPSLKLQPCLLDSRPTNSPVYPSPRAPLAEIPPQNPFAGSITHAQGQGQPPLRRPILKLQTCLIDPESTNRSCLEQSLPSLALPNQSKTLPNQANILSEDSGMLYPHYISSPSSSSMDDEIIAQPPSSHRSTPRLPSYLDTVFPQTLAKKDKRVLGVPLTADIDEYVLSSFHAQDLQLPAFIYHD